MFGSPSPFATSGTSLFSRPTTVTNQSQTPASSSIAPTANDVEVPSPPDDSVSSMEFSPASLPTMFLAAGSWDNNVRCWEIQQNTTIVPKAMQSHDGPVLDVAWSDDGTKIFTASTDKTAKMWDLGSNQTVQIAQHDAPVKTAHWIKGSSYNCLMTGSWDKTLKFWDLRSPNPILTFNLPERVYCADVMYPMAVVGTAGRQVIVYQLDNQPKEFKSIDSPLKFQHRCVKIFADRKASAPVGGFGAQSAASNLPVGFALGSIEGRVAIQYINAPTPKDNFTFKCHRSNPPGATVQNQDIFAVNGLAFHPTHCTLGTVGSDGRICFWDKDSRTKLKTTEALEQPVTTCCIDAQGTVFAYSLSYDWSKGHESYDPSKMKPRIFLRSCSEDMKPRQK